jgi:intron-binding protein aquarius
MGPRTRGKQESQREVDEGRPTVADLQGESPFAQLAKEHWLKPSKKGSKVKVKPDLIKAQVWDVLQRDNFAFKSLLVLENLQILEKHVPYLFALILTANRFSRYLWPGYSEDSSNFQVLLIVLIANVRIREHLSTWGECTNS